MIARHLLNAGAHVEVYMCADASQLSGDARIYYEISLQNERQHFPLQQEADLQRFIMSLMKTDMVVDAV